MARIRTVFADKGYDAERHRELCRAFAAKPSIHKRGQPRGSGLGKHRWPVERSNAWVLENKRLALRYDPGFTHEVLEVDCYTCLGNCESLLTLRGAVISNLGGVFAELLQLPEGFYS